MADQTEDPIVVFELADGTEVSNDPRWKAKKILASTGVDVSALEARIAELEAEKAEAEAGATAEVDETDAASEEGDEYDQLNGAELKALAKDRGVDIAGLTKVGQVREALRAADQG